MAAKSNEIAITRIYDAPVKLVWDAWTDPAQVAQWWGPRGFTITHISKDLRPGGHWKYIMHGPDGKDWPNNTKYHVVEKYKRLEYDHGGTDDTPPLFKVRVTFTEMGKQTKMEMIMALETAEAAKQTKKFIKDAGGNGTWDRLGEFLEKEQSGKEQFLINRTFEVPLETMFKVWTDPKHLAKWLSPTGTEMKFIHVDIKSGGNSFYTMFGPQMTLHGKIHYVEVKSPDRLVYEQQFCDENERVSRHPMAPTWPETMLTTVLLSAESPTETRVTITWEPKAPFTKEELETFVKARAGMTMGWTGSFDKLEEYLTAL